MRTVFSSFWKYLVMMLFFIVLINSKGYSLSSSFSLISMGKNYTEIEFNLDNLEYLPEDIDGTEFFRLYHPEAIHLMNEGLPELMSFSVLVSVPLRGSVSLDKPKIHSNKLISDINIYPSQGFNYEIDEKRGFLIDEYFYSQSLSYPDITSQISAPALMRDVRLVSVTLTPFAYNPQQKELTINNRISFRVNYDESAAGENELLTPKSKISRSFESLYEESLINYEQFRNPNREYQARSLLVIRNANTGINTLVNQFVDWKKDKGFEVTVATTAGMSTATAITNYISNAYHNWANPPEHVIIIGNQSGTISVPIHSILHPEVYSSASTPVQTDNSFVTIVGNDDLPDIFIGRIAVINSNQMATYMNKFNNYEVNPYMQETAWYERNLLTGDHRVSGVSTILTNKYVKEKMLNYYPNYSFNEVYDLPYKTQMRNAINNGVSFHNFRGLQDVGDWQYPTDTELYNGYKLNNSLIITCRTMLHADNLHVDQMFRMGTPTVAKGSITSIGMSHLTRTAFNNSLGGGIFHGIFVENQRTMGEALARGKLNLWQSFINSHWAAEGRRHLRMINLYGDPSMNIWVKTPMQLNVSYNTQLPIGSNSVVVTVTDAHNQPVENTWVTIRQDDNNIFSTDYTDNNGQVTLLFSPDRTGTVKITATKPDYIPHRGTFLISGSASVSYNSFVANNPLIAGNNVNFVVSVKNYATQQAFNVNGSISTESEHVNITNSHSSYGNISAGNTATSNNEYSITLSHDTPAGHQALFLLTITDGNNNSWTSRFILEIQNGNLTPVNIVISDGNNGILNPGEQANIILSIKNEGSTSLQNISGLLYGATNGISISNNSTTFGNINAGQTVSSSVNHFSVAASSFAIPGMSFDLKVRLYNDAGFNQIQTINIPIGTVSVNTPLGPDEYGYWAYDIGDTGYDEAPSYSWIEISPTLGGPGINTGLQSDHNNQQTVTSMNLPFTFKFYGIDYNVISICANGWVTFGATEQATQRNWRLPGPLGPSPIIAAFWDNLSTSGGGIYTHYNQNIHAFIIQWQNVKNVINNAVETFQIILYDPDEYFTVTGDGPIKIQYRTFNNVNNGANTPSGIGNWGNYCTVGIADHNGLVGIEYTFNNRYPTAARTLSNQSALFFTTGSSTAVLTLEDYSFTDNNNNIPECGDTIQIGISLHNSGNVNAQGVTATLSSNNPYVNITDNSIEAGNIASMATVDLENAFTVEIAPNTPHLHQIVFNLNINSSDNQLWSDTIVMTVNGPKIEINEVIITDDNNNIPEYGETIYLDIALLNSGEYLAENVTAHITSNDPYLALIDDTAIFGDIDSNEIVHSNQTFSLQIADNVPNQHRLSININISADNDNEWTETFYIDVNSPALATLTPIVHDPAPGGDGNGLIDPGEELIIYLPIKNSGGNSFENFTIEVTSLHPMAEITEYVSEYPPIAGNEVFYPEIHLSIDPELENGTNLVFEYVYTLGNYVFSGTFNKYVGVAITAQIGNGVSASATNNPSPVNIYYRSLRTQMVYTSNELIQAGAIPGLPIIQLGFYIEGAPAHPLPNFTIRMKHTTANNASSHDSGPYTTTYTCDEYQPTAGGWDMLYLTTPFTWNGVDNILLDTAFSPASSWNASGRVRINTINDGFRYVRSDSGDQTNVNTTTVANDRPQIMLRMGSDSDEAEHSPRNLSTTLVGTDIRVDWETPLIGELFRKSKTRLSDNRSKLNLRDPLGYNVYRNGIKVNETLVLDTEYIDSDYNAETLYYYYATAVFESYETIPSNIKSIKIHSLHNPVADIESGIYSEPFIVTVTPNDDNDTIYYTLDGSEPTMDSAIYEQPLLISSYKTTLKIKALALNTIPSNTIEYNYLILNPPVSFTGESNRNDITLSWNIPQLIPNNTRFDRSSFKHKKRLETKNQNYSSRELRGYNIYRTTGDDLFVKINEELITETSYYDNNLEIAVYLYYATTVYDEGESQATEIITVSVNKVSEPFFSIDSGVFDDPITLSITCYTEDAVIYYTLDGSAPDETSPMFDEEVPIDITYTTLIKAIAFRQNWIESDVVAVYYYILNPVSNFVGESFYDTVYLSWDAPPTGEQNTNNRRTRFARKNNDSRELVGYNIYRKASDDEDYVLINETNQTEFADSGLSEGSYSYFVTSLYTEGESNPTDISNFTIYKASSPLFSVEPSTYTTPIELELSTEIEDASIYYTTNGSTPDENSILYEEAITIAVTTTIKAVTYKYSWIESDVVIGEYIIDATNTEENLIVPTTTKLHPAYPNPFNPKTNISFSLAQEGIVSLEIYNLLGMKVKTIYSGHLNIGNHNFIWEGDDSYNKKLSSGIYFYKMTSAGFKDIKKIILLK